MMDNQVDEKSKRAMVRGGRRQAVVQAAWFLLLAFGLLLMVESIARVSVWGMLGWISQPDIGQALRYNYIWTVLFLGLLSLLTGRMVVGMGLGALVMTSLAAVHAGKTQILQQPLLPSDFQMVAVVLKIWSSAYFPFSFWQAGGLLAVVLIWVGLIWFLLGSVRFCRKLRWWLIPLTGACLFYFSTHVASLAARKAAVEQKLTVVWQANTNEASDALDEVGVQNPDYSVMFNYQSFGFIAGFFHNFDDRSREGGGGDPPPYKEEDILRFWSEWTGQAPDPVASPAPNERPHVVLVLSESFWDPNDLEGVEIKSSPTTNFHRIGTEPGGHIFQVVAPIFGGYTCKTEFELLSGIPMAMLPTWMVPHRRHFDADVPSLPAVFKAHGYRTVAVHPYLPDFWNRNIVFPLIGFDRFLHIKNMEHRTVKGKFIGDDALADEVISIVDAADGPLFLLAISMQNHSPYGDGRYGEVEVDSVRVVDDHLDPASVRDYVHGVRDADVMLSKLVEHFRASPRPVVLLFLGDHQPPLIPPEAVPGMFAQRIKPEKVPPGLAIKARYFVPALVWSSRGNAPSFPSHPVSTAALAPHVLQAANLPLPPFYRMSAQVFHRFPVVHHGWGMRENGRVFVYRDFFEDDLLLGFHKVCHDIVLGRQVSQAAGLLSGPP